jgi:hypothetical protein
MTIHIENMVAYDRPLLGAQSRIAALPQARIAVNSGPNTVVGHQWEMVVTEKILSDPGDGRAEKIGDGNQQYTRRS